MENNKKNRNRAITAEIFACVKILIANGASRAEAAKYMKIGISTVDRIISAETFEEYKNILAAMNAKYHETYREKRLAKKGRTRSGRKAGTGQGRKTRTAAASGGTSAERDGPDDVLRQPEAGRDDGSAEGYQREAGLHH